MLKATPPSGGSGWEDGKILEASFGLRFSGLSDDLGTERGMRHATASPTDSGFPIDGVRF